MKKLLPLLALVFALAACCDQPNSCNSYSNGDSGYYQPPVYIHHTTFIHHTTVIHHYYVPSSRHR